MELLFAEKPPIPLHAIAALLAVVLGGIQILMKKGTRLHRCLGWVWVGLMLVISFSSFFISNLKTWGYFSPIHLLSIMVIFFIGSSIYYVRIGNIKRHRSVMISLYWLALILTGLFTLLPGRLMHQVIFG